MAEVDRVMFAHKELAEVLVRHQDLKEGLWGLALEFGLSATNLKTGPDQETLLPSAIVPVVKIGLQRFQEPNNLTVDAAKVNPKRGTSAKSGPEKRR